jgi:hypothetical protein
MPIVATPAFTTLVATFVEPPYPQWLIIEKDVPKPYFDYLGELHNLYVQIPMLQALKEIPIYAKTIRDMCLKKLRRNPNNPKIVKIGGKLSPYVRKILPY